MVTFDHVASEVRRLLRGDRCEIWEYDKKNNCLNILIPPSGENRNSEFYYQKYVLLDQHPHLTDFLFSGKPLLIENLRDEAIFGAFSYLAKSRLFSSYRSLITVPLLHQGYLLGVVNCFKETTFYFTTAEHKESVFEMLSAYVNLAAEAIHTHERSTVFYESSLQIIEQEAELHERSSTVKLDHLLHVILKQAVELLEGTGGNIYLRVPNEKKVELKAITSSNGEITIKEGRTIPFGEGMAGRVIQGKKPLIVNDYGTWGSRTEEFSEDFKAVIEVPLLVGTKAIGVLGVFDNSEKRTFTSSDIPTLERFAQQAAFAIQRRQNNERRMIQQEVTEAIRAASDLKSVADTILKGLDKFIPFDKATLQLVDTDGNTRQIIDWAGYDEEQIDVEELLKPVDEDPLLQKILNREDSHRRDPYVLSGTSQEPLWDVLPTTIDVKSWICAPLFFGDRLMGFLTLDHTKKDYYQPRDAAVLLPIIQAAAIAINNSRQLEAKENQVNALTALDEISKSINAEFDPDILLQKIATLLKENLDCSQCTIFIYDRESKALVPKATAGRHEDLSKTEVVFKPYDKKQQGIAGWVFVHCKALVLPDAREHEAFIPTGASPRSMVAAPITVGHQVKGVITVDHTKTNQFGEYERILLEALAQQAGMAILRSDGSNMLLKISEEILGAYDLTDILSRAIEGATRITNTNQGIIHLINETNDEIVGSICFPEESKQVKPRLSQGEGLTKYLIEKEDLVAIPNVDKTDYPINPEVSQNGFRSVIGLRLQYRGQRLGVMYLDDKKTHHFSDIEKSYLKTLASYAAIAISKKNLLDELDVKTEALTTRKAESKLISELLLEKDLNSIIERTLRFLNGLCNSRVASLWLPTENGLGESNEKIRVVLGAVVVGAERDQTDKDKELEQKLSQSGLYKLDEVFIGRFLLEKDNVDLVHIAHDSGEHYADVWSEYREEIGTNHLVAFPIRVVETSGDSGILGIISLRPLKDDFALDEAMEEEIKRLARYIRVFIEQARYSLRYQRIDILKSRLIIPLDAGQFFNEICELIKDVMGAEACSIFGYDREKNALYLDATTASYTTNVEEAGKKHPIPERRTVIYGLDDPQRQSITGEAFKKGETTMIYDVEAHDQWSGYFIEETTTSRHKSLIAAPIFNSKGQKVGIIRCINKQHDNPLLLPVFTTGDKEFMELITGIISSFIEVVHAAEERSRFMMHMSHELRSPLHALKAYIDYAEDLRKVKGGVNKLAGAFQYMRDETAFMDHLVNNFQMQVVRTRTTGDRYQFKKQEIFPIMQRVHRLLRTVAKEDRKIDIRVVPSKTPFPPLYIDKMHMEQVFFNLIQNAIKYSIKGAKDINIEEKRTRDAFIIDVKNWGIGVPPGEEDDIFKEFEQGSNAYLGETSGSGVGLSVSRTIIERHGGTLTLYQSVQILEGLYLTTFRIRLPQSLQHKAPD